MTSCDTDLLSQYLDRALTLPQRIHLEEHLLSCESCRRELVQLQQLDRMLTSWGATRRPLPVGTERRIAQSVERRKRPSVMLSIGRMMPAAVGTGIAAMLVLVTVNLASIHPPAVTTHSSPSVAAAQRQFARQSASLFTIRRNSAILGGYAGDGRHAVPLSYRRVQLDLN